MLYFDTHTQDTKSKLTETWSTELSEGLESALSSWGVVI